MIDQRVVAVATPIMVGLLIGAEAVAGMLMVGTIAGVMLATVLNNGGGAWDNAKKYIESGNLKDVSGNILGKGSDAHAAAVVGDTVGDPFKDTAGPSLHVLAWLLVVATIPALIIGVLLNDAIASRFREVGLVAVTLVIGAAILWLAERTGSRRLLAVDLTFPRALAIGVAQAAALVPGISRSGISIAAGLFTGLNRESAARFSFLMATPVTAAAAAYEGLKVIKGDVGVAVPIEPLLVGLVASFVCGILAIAVLLRFLRTRSTDIFVAYRILIAAVIVVWWLR